MVWLEELGSGIQKSSGKHHWGKWLVRNEMIRAPAPLNQL